MEEPKATVKGLGRVERKRGARDIRENLQKQPVADSGEELVLKTC